MLGYQTPEDLVGKRLHNIIHHTHADGTPYAEEDCAISASLQKGEGIHSDEEIFGAPMAPVSPLNTGPIQPAGREKWSARS